MKGSKMKTTWKIMPHCLAVLGGARMVLWASGYKLGQVENGRVCINIEVEPFTDRTYLVVAKWVKIVPPNVQTVKPPYVFDSMGGNCGYCGKPLADHKRVQDSIYCEWDAP
jgi:hypothetical protein